MEADLFKRTGMMAIGSRLRQFTDRITADAGKIDKIYESELQPKWFPVFYMLSLNDGQSITEIARNIGHTHASVITIVKEMSAADLVRTKQDPRDKRRVIVSLTAKSKRLIPKINMMCHDVRMAIEQINAQATQNLWQAINEWEKLLDEKSLFDRVIANKVKRESDDLQIVDYDDTKHHEAFLKLNERWIRDLFHMEQEDLDQLNHPMENIINKGGFIFIAEYKGEPVGTFAVMPCELPGYDWEFVKFAVNPDIRGKGIGKRLIKACLEKVQSLGGNRLYLETNKRCEAAIHLYQKYGFKFLTNQPTNYERADVFMEKTLEY
ncbi:MAG: bifunctional helix-turn-helix transcriptional regulator/GNAT family N-acetyltransferase [Prevotella sp.]